MARRRGHGEGSVYQRSSDGRWVATLDLVPLGSGPRRRKTLYGRTRREVVDKLAVAKRQQEAGCLVVDERTTVEQFVQAWLETVRPTIRASTWTRYEQYGRRHVVPQLGRLRLTRVGPQQVQAFYADRLSAGLSPQTVLHLHRFLHRALGQAVRWGLVSRNVTELVDPPRVSRHEFQVLTPEQVRRLISGARGHRLEALFVLAVTTGMRQGELLSLRWRDVDLDSGRLSVVREPKTPRSRRQVLLTSAAGDALRRHRVAQSRERLLLGEAWDDLDLAFPNTIGRPITPQNLVQRQFYPLLARLELPQVRFHDLRHSAATMLLGQGVHAKIVSEMLGHAQTAITLDLYSHVSPTMQAAAVRALDDLLGCQPGCQEQGSDGEAAGQPS